MTFQAVSEAVVTMEAVKACSKCARLLPLDSFGIDRGRPDGRYPSCKDCRHAYAVESRGRTSDYNRRYSQALKANEPERYRLYIERASASLAADPVRKQRRAAREMAARRRNPEPARERCRRWRMTHLEQDRQRAMARRALKHEAKGAATVAQVAARWAYYGHRCWMCGDPATQTDHVIALARGGSNWPANLRPACGPCNSAKGARW